MNITKEQTESILSNFLQKEKGLNDVLQMMLNAGTCSEHQAFLDEAQGNKGNGHRLGKVFGYGAQIELRIPRDRLSAFSR